MRLKLFLSSYRLGREPGRLRDLVGDIGIAGIVLNACDVYEQRDLVLEREAEDLQSLGFAAEELDLRQYFNSPKSLPARLDRYCLVWAVGGNAFVLARAIAASGFGAAALDRIAAGSMVQGGYSAGACVTGPDLKGIELMDDPDVLSEGYSSSMARDGLGWVPWRVVPHWRSDHPDAANADQAVKLLEAEALRTELQVMGTSSQSTANSFSSERAGPRDAIDIERRGAHHQHMGGGD